MTTTGNTMECSANRNSARGSDSSTEVSNTYVRSACAADVGVDVAGFTRARLAECSTLAVSSEVTIAPTSELYSDPWSASDTLHRAVTSRLDQARSLTISTLRPHPRNASSDTRRRALLSLDSAGGNRLGTRGNRLGTRGNRLGTRGGPLDARVDASDPL